MSLDQLIKPIVTFCTLVFIGVSVRVMHNPKLFKICTAVLGTLVISIGIYALVKNLSGFLHSYNHPIDREILSQYEVADAERQRTDTMHGLLLSSGVLLVGIMDILMAFRLNKLKNDEVKTWLKLPVMFQLGLIFIISLLSMFIKF